MIVFQETAANHNPAVKARAEAERRFAEANTGRRFVVEYRDHYDDTRVRGDYIVRAA